jgi:tRNA1(Val) A37 N6-methylase TrmN6
MERALSEEETLDRLAGDWQILQLRRGHRYATDDVLTAWIALLARPAARSVLDLGAGVGSIGFLVLRLLAPEARLTAVEALAESHSLALRTAERNGIGHRVDLRLGDLRAAGVLGSSEAFDLIVANPPFLTPGTAWASPYPERSAARFELRGDLFDYCRVAARHIAEEGRLCFCFPATDPRAEAAVAQAGLAVLESRRVVFRQGRPPRLALFVCGRRGERKTGPDLCVRDRTGQRTAAYLEVMRLLEMVE